MSKKIFFSVMFIILVSCSPVTASERKPFRTPVPAPAVPTQTSWSDPVILQPGESLSLTGKNGALAVQTISQPTTAGCLMRLQVIYPNGTIYPQQCHDMSRDNPKEISYELYEPGSADARPLGVNIVVRTDLSIRINYDITKWTPQNGP